MFNLPEKFVIVDGYKIPADKAEEYRKTKERMEKEAEKFFKGFCEIVKKEPLLDLLGHGVVGYSSTGEQLARISLDPFEISAMNVALGRILATNGYDEYAYQQLLKEYKIRHENK